MKTPFVNFGQQYLVHKPEYDRAINRCLENGKLILQEDVEEFEDKLAKRLGMKHCIGVANGTDAILLGLKAKNVDAEVLVTSGYTFKATMEAIAHTNKYTVGILDVEEDRLMAKTDLPSVPVHIEGMVCRQDNAVLEDAAQAIGAEGVGYSGTFTLSFYPAKILGGFGDGGAILTNDDEVNKRARLLRHNWQTNEDEKYAYNSRLDNVQAAFLNVKLQYLGEILRRRREIAEKYRELEGLVGLPIYQEGRVWQDYVITVSEPKKLKAHLESKDIEVLGVGMVPPHRAFGKGGLELPNTERLYSRMLRLPCNETLSDQQIKYVIDAVREFYV